VKGRWCGGRDLAHPKILAWRPLAGRGREREGMGEERKGRRGADNRKRGGRKVGTGPPIG